MSLLGAIADYYDNGTGTGLDTLRTALGDGEMWADVLPGNVAFPYIALAEVSRTVATQARAPGNRNRTYDATVAFAIFATTRSNAEAIADAIDVAYSHEDAQLSIDGYTHMATTYANRVSYYDDASDSWRAQIEMQFKISSGSN